MNELPCRPETPIDIRWPIPQDFPAILATEAACFDDPWCEAELRAVLRRHDCFGLVATRRPPGAGQYELDDPLVGFVAFRNRPRCLEVLDLAVHPDHRRRGVGRRMVAKLVGRLSPRRRTRIVLHVRDGNLPAQLFFRATGFRAVATLRGHYETTGEDAYLMQYRLPVPAGAAPA
jgi:[ribosomal protein S18]-alanine N-acetyltransferase